MLLSDCGHRRGGEEAFPALRDEHSDVPWRDIAGMRDRLIHGYDSVDHDELWKTSIEDVPKLLDQILSIVGPDLLWRASNYFVAGFEGAGALRISSKYCCTNC